MIVIVVHVFPSTGKVERKAVLVLPENDFITPFLKTCLSLFLIATFARVGFSRQDASLDPVHP